MSPGVPVTAYIFGVCLPKLSLWSDCGLRVFSVASSHQREPAGKTHTSE